MQDVAYADVDDAGVADHAVWVVRRMRIKVNHFPRFGDHLRPAHVLQRHRPRVGRATDDD